MQNVICKILINVNIIEYMICCNYDHFLYILNMFSSITMKHKKLYINFHRRKVVFIL